MSIVSKKRQMADTFRLSPLIIKLFKSGKRILVMKECRIAKELPHANVDQEEVLKWAL